MISDKISWDEVFWAAGFFEGEGSIGTRAAFAQQVNRWPLERLEAVFGGTVGERARPGRDENQQPCWHWSIGGQQCRNFIKLIYPHLSPKRQRQIDDKFITDERRLRNRASLRGPRDVCCTLQEELASDELAERRLAIMWAAGFYEGEGCVGRVHVTFNQVNRWPLEWLTINFGGNIGKQNPRTGNRQPIWQCAICGEDGRAFIKLIYPHLSPSRQAQIDRTFRRVVNPYVKKSQPTRFVNQFAFR